MGEFGNTAVKAAGLLQNNKNLCPKKAWDKEISDTNLSASSQKKACPKWAFLGLCRKGLIPNTRVYKELPNKINGVYAVEACHILQKWPQNESLPTQKALWEQVFQNLKIDSKSLEGQLDVVFCLWRKELIRCQ